MSYHHHTATIALALALAAGVPAAAAAQPGQPNSPAPSSPCSEVCSGGGYESVSPPSRTQDHSSAHNTATIPPAAVHVATHSDSFHWGDAGVGAGGMLALTAIGIGGALTLTRRRNQHIHE